MIFFLAVVLYGLAGYLTIRYPLSWHMDENACEALPWEVNLTLAVLWFLVVYGIAAYWLCYFIGRTFKYLNHK